jgi:hypothetical protein
MVERFVCYYPFGNKVNRYNSRNVSALVDAGYKVGNLRDLFFSSGAFSERVIILNWVESLPVRKKGGLSPRGLIRLVLLICVVVVKNPKVIWVKHNHSPHNARGLGLWLSRKIEKFLERRAWGVVVHSESLARRRNCHYVAHPLYNDELVKQSGVLQKRFLFVGTISRYKGLQELLDVWPQGVGLDIYGRVLNQKYGENLISTIKKRNLDVSISQGYIDEKLLAEKLGAYFAMVLPHKEETAVVSGSYFLAKSAGMLVLRRDLESDYGVVSFGDGENLSESIDAVIQLANKLTREEIFKQAQEHNGQKIIGCQWSVVFESGPTLKFGQTI